MLGFEVYIFIIYLFRPVLDIGDLVPIRMELRPPAGGLEFTPLDTGEVWGLGFREAQLLN